MKRAIALAAACAGLLCNAAQGQAACLDEETVGAARAIEFQVAMMVASLRCGAVKLDITTEFQAFAGRHKKAFDLADNKLRSHFGAKSKTGMIDYQHFMTSLGNHYGAERTDVQSCLVFKSVASELAKPDTDAASMTRYFAALVPEPMIEGDRCTVRLAKEGGSK